MKHLIKLSIFLSLISNSFSFYFYLKEDEQRCFSEDLPADTTLTGHYSVQQKSMTSKKYEESELLGINVIVTQNDARTLLSKFYSKTGRFLFNSDHEGSTYTICIIAQSSMSHDQKRTMDPHIMVKLEFSSGDRPVEENIAKEKMNSLELHVVELIDQTDHIIKEQNFQKKREITFRAISSKTSNRVLFWAAFQVVVLILASLWQIHHLRKFFVSKKIM
uniref:Transmembrane emp24 domain-containing protein eca (Trinotate prediction) n=1 Tax=Myxobolus squamalis TaxID=59785 RepID=A0A6B2G747_MYXSQ